MVLRLILLSALLLSLAGCDSAETLTPRLVAPRPPLVTATAPAPVPPTPAARATAPTGPPTAAQAYVMYLEVSNVFFNSQEVQRLLRPDLLKQRVVYIYPAFDYGREGPVPDAILALLARHGTALRLRRVPQEVAGGLVVSVSKISRDPDNTRLVYGKEGATISISVAISGAECGTWTGISYLLTATQQGWLAEGYQSAVC